MLAIRFELDTIDEWKGRGPLVFHPVSAEAKLHAFKLPGHHPTPQRDSPTLQLHPSPLNGPKAEIIQH